MREEETNQTARAMSEEIIPVSRAAALLGVSRVSVHNWIREGRVKALHLPPHGRVQGVKLFLMRSEVERLKQELRRRGRLLPAEGES